MSDPKETKDTEKAPKPVKLSRPYSTGKWSGKTYYRCKICDYDAWSQSEFDNHVCNKHRAEAEDKE